MDKETRNDIERATQRARKLLEEDFAAQLEGDFDVHRDGKVAAKAGRHLSARQAFQRERIVAAIEHKRAAGMTAGESVADYLRDAAFTTLNRFVALKMLEARELVQECITKGEQSAGYREFCGMAPGLPLLPDGAGYRLYIESLFDELSTEVKVLFDRRDPSSVLWPKRATFDQLLEVLNAIELARVWAEDETIGWVYQFFNGQDERKKMREESQAPRNSRELAVRNQFFTPRYVVQFLTDNTLGRIWYEMRGTKTVLAEKCEYMVRKPNEEFSPYALKDPRDLRVLDPACGSGHFLLYAFDLLLAIYVEAHGDPAAPKSETTGRTLAEDYPNTNEFRAVVPSLILAHNLYGVDIDPRCAQIAQLAVWMRAQKAYRDFGVGRGGRTPIRRSNIVVAEPLVADDNLAREFIANLGDAELGRLFMSLVGSLNLAGDLGLLLRVETLVSRSPKRGETGNLFQTREECIRTALARFVDDVAGRTSTRRRLFVDDAAHGVALLGVAEKRFDVVLMNPPFGAGSARAKKSFENAYPRTKNDVYAAFVERGIELLSARGRLGAITSRTGFFLSSFQKWREEIVLADAPPRVIGDLGFGVMDAALVEAAAYVLERSPPAAAAGRTMIIRALEETNDKNAALRAALGLSSHSTSATTYEVDPSTFSSIPLSPFAYWLTDSIRGLFRAFPALHGDDRIVASGASSNDDVRFVRAWWEVPQGLATSFSFAKGGKFSPFYDDVHLHVRWRNDGREIKAHVEQNRAAKGWSPHWKAELHNPHLYFRPGLTWPRRTKSPLSFRVLPGGCIFGDKGPALFVAADAPEYLLALLATTTSKVFRYLVEVQLAAADSKRGGAARSYEVGVLQRTPIPPNLRSHSSSLAAITRQVWSARRDSDRNNETSHAFVHPSATDSERETECVALRARIEDMLFELYAISSEDRTIIEAAFAETSPAVRSDHESAPIGDMEDELDEEGAGLADNVALVSWLVGACFARFDTRVATGERVPCSGDDPFEPLSDRSPAMFPRAEQPLAPELLVTDDGHPDDLATRVLRLAERVQAPVRDDLRTWLAKEFFPLHIRMYSKSRRKAPIYWQLATPSASYSVWLYIHSFSKDTLFRVQNDYVGGERGKLAHEERRLASMMSEAREKATAAQRKDLAVQENLVEELRAFLEEVKRVAPLWNPNLEDGVVLSFAPLWRLVPHCKPWQKELKATWDILAEGTYDWAHVAMHLWPERVVPKCATDRSLAIAHDLEDVFWVEGTDGKWTARKTPTRSIEELVRERTSPAVKSALSSLLEAPGASGSSGRGGGGRRNAATSAERGER